MAGGPGAASRVFGVHGIDLKRGRSSYRRDGYAVDGSDSDEQAGSSPGAGADRLGHLPRPAAEQQRVLGPRLPGGQIEDLNRLAEITRATTAVPVGAAIISRMSIHRAASPICTHGWKPARPAGCMARPGSPRKTPPSAGAERPPGPPRPGGATGAGARPLPAAASAERPAQPDGRDRCAGAILLLAPRPTPARRGGSGGDATLVIDQCWAGHRATRARETARRRCDSCPACRIPRHASAGWDSPTATSTVSATTRHQLVIWGDAGAIAARIGQYRRARRRPRHAPRAERR